MCIVIVRRFTSSSLRGLGSKPDYHIRLWWSGASSSSRLQSLDPKPDYHIIVVLRLQRSRPRCTTSASLPLLEASCKFFKDSEMSFGTFTTNTMMTRDIKISGILKNEVMLLIESTWTPKYLGVYVLSIRRQHGKATQFLPTTSAISAQLFDLGMMSGCESSAREQALDMAQHLVYSKQVAANWHMQLVKWRSTR
ncbi:hypothetical protein WAI453_004757 [Rhynchosporium graminicola]